MRRRIENIRCHQVALFGSTTDANAFLATFYENGFRFVDAKIALAENDRDILIIYTAEMENE